MSWLESLLNGLKKSDVSRRFASLYKQYFCWNGQVRREKNLREDYIYFDRKIRRERSLKEKIIGTFVFDLLGGLILREKYERF